jgi:hypothetical protein
MESPVRLVKLLPLVAIVATAAGLVFGASSRVEADWPADCLPSATIQFVECFNVGADTDVADDTTVAGDTNTVVTDQNAGWTDPDGAGDDCAIRAEELRVNGATTPQPCESPAVTGFTSYTVTFDWGGDVATGTTLTVEYSTDGGTTFQTLETFTLAGDQNTCGGPDGSECATTEHSETVAGLSCADGIVLRFVGTTVENDDYYIDDLLLAGVGEECVPVPDDTTSLQIDKVFDGAADTEFTFTVAQTGCQIDFDNDGFSDLFVPIGGTFTLTPADDPAYLYCDGQATITEEPGTGFTFDSITGCEAAFVTFAGATVTFTPTEGDATVVCTFNNATEAVGDDDPAIPNIAVSKVCVGEGFEATFEITVGEESGAVECGGDPVTAVDLEPGSYDITETIEGADADGFATVIVCSDGTLAEGTSASVTIPAEGALDVTCVVINVFDPGLALEDLLALLCGCPIDIEIDIDNTNGNTIGIDNSNANNNANNNDNDNLNANENKNENDNKNENTQDQTNTQDQNNENSQTNNITSSPEVNISGMPKKPAPAPSTGGAVVTPPSTGEGPGGY